MRSLKGEAGLIKRKINPRLGALEVRDMTRAPTGDFMANMKAIPRPDNHMLSRLRKMMNVAEVWGYRDDGPDPRRHVPKYPENGALGFSATQSTEAPFRSWRWRLARRRDSHSGAR